METETLGVIDADYILITILLQIGLLIFLKRQGRPDALIILSLVMTKEQSLGLNKLAEGYLNANMQGLLKDCKETSCGSF